MIVIIFLSESIVASKSILDPLELVSFNVIRESTLVSVSSELSVFLIATLASFFADFIKRHKWLGYLGLFVILIIALQLIIGGLVNYEVLSINEKFKFLFAI